MISKKQKRIIRHKRVKDRIGNPERYRLSVFRSNKHIYCQIIDDTNSKTLLSSSDVKQKGKNKIERAKEVGTTIAKLSSAMKIKEIVFDRGGYKYHGRVKALAEGAREGGLVF